MRPPLRYESLPIHDARLIAATLDIDAHGFELHKVPTVFTEFYEDALVRRNYYPEVATFLKHALQVTEVLVFDHNTRSAIRAARGDPA